ncbi:hypothetical protein PRIPAC_74078 [Pristionchus pacificus]|uniref:Uncharacterized protein n=1 Tax=Pristionchus pacificus TaxID=54126 RepID=A0A2A6CRI0_PRIPA|nr:hypothetical protein PRIPAC_74078 [Pristionchus pacificus]|eukprot:PDM80667.1 hypothetical protein PRIPAC_35670 [Pristionchus pacificus]
MAVSRVSRTVASLPHRPPLSLSRLRDKYYPNVARTWNYAIKYRAVAENYRFEKIDDHHLPQLMDLSKGFYEDESVTRATGSTMEGFRKGMEYAFAYAIAANSVTNISDICYDNKTNKPIGIRMIHPYYRDPTRAPFSIPASASSTDQEITLFTLLDETFNQVWKRFPNENAILKGELIYIDRAYRADTGLYKAWIDYDVDFPTVVKQSGAGIYAIPCTARQTKLGYTASYSRDPHVVNADGETVPLPQGDIRLYTIDMRTTSSINVKPCWEKMKACGMMPK